MCKVHGSSSVHLSYLLTQAGVVVLAGLQLRPQLLAALLHALHLRLQLCYATCSSQALHLFVAAHLHAGMHDLGRNMYGPNVLGELQLPGGIVATMHSIWQSYESSDVA